MEEPLRVRPYGCRDREPVLALLARIGAWDAEGLRQFRSGRGAGCLVAERGGARRPRYGGGDWALVGVLLYRLIPPVLRIEALVVDRAHRRQGIAARLHDRALEHAAALGAGRAYAEVSEYDEAGHHFLAALGWRAVAVLPRPDWFATADAYRFTRGVPGSRTGGS